MPHLSELHGAATHLAIVAIPLYALALLARRLGRGQPTLAVCEPWLLGGAAVGVALAGATGLLVWGQARTTLRGSHLTLGTAHFWIGIALATLVAALVLARLLAARSAAPALLAGGLLALTLVLVQGYLGGRMTYAHGVGLDAAGELAQSAAGAERLDVALARGTAPVSAGRMAFSPGGLGCAGCHGMRAQGLRGPRLAGGVDLRDFRRVHGHGLFPPTIVSDRDFAAIDAYLRTLPY